MIYKALAPIPTKVSPDVIGREIAAIQQESGGVCPPQAYVDRARPENSPIHDTLPWDDVVLAEEARRQRARAIIQVIVAVEDESDLPPLNVHVTVTTSDGEEIEGYAPVRGFVDQRPDLCDQVLTEFLRRVKGDIRNHGWVTELAPIILAIEKIERSLAEDREPVAA